MEKTLWELLKAYVDSQKFNSTTEIMTVIKEIFRDVLQQVMESELDTDLGVRKKLARHIRGPAGVLGAPAGVDDSPPQGWIGCCCTAQRA